MNDLWYYAASNGEKKGPVSREDIRRFIEKGALKEGDLVWRDGLPDWAPISTLPELQGSADLATAVIPGLEPPSSLRTWMTFVGVMNIVLGALYSLSCVGIIGGVLLIVAGVALLGARNAIDQIGPITAGLDEFLRKLNTFLLVYGVFYILMLVGIIVGLIFYAAVFFTALGGAWGNGY